uniref:Uncharacterized protein n=1 Tax=Photinus pyralis TaxID=7054 RepID=A0A1Y1M1R8_PHOPY
MSYREVIPDQSTLDGGREITLNTGGTQSTLQDIKVSEKANGYCYRPFAKHTRNRFIYWRINRDVLELTEQSLDVNLTGNKIKYRFIDTPILDGITIYETPENVIILVPTVCSVHRLIFLHPDLLQGHAESSGFHPDLTIPSIFAETPSSRSQDSGLFNVFTNPNASNSELPQVATSLLTATKEAIFSFSYPSGETLLVTQSANGSCVTIELKHESFVPRFIFGIAEKLWSKTHADNVVVSMLLHTFGNDTYALTLCKDGNLRVWCCVKGTCIAVHNIVSESYAGENSFVNGTHNHVLRKTEGQSRFELTLVVFMNLSAEREFRVFSVYINSGQFKIAKRNTLYSPGQNLVDFNLSSNQIWSMWRSEDGEISVYCAPLVTNSSKGTYWIPAMLEPVPDANFVPDMDSFDPRQAYLNHIFYPSRFPLHIISKALSIYKPTPILSDVNLSTSILKQRVCLAVEGEIVNELKEGEVNDEDYLECAYRCWAKFYSCCVQYHYVAGLQPLGLLLLPSASGVVLLKKSMYSFLRPHDALEHMMLCSDYATVDDFVNHPLLSRDRDVTEDVLKLMSVVVYMETQLSDSFAYTFERELSQLRSPDVIVSELITEIMTELEPLLQKLNDCKDIYQAMHKLLELLRIETPDDLDNEVGEGLQTLNYLFSSHLGVSLVTKCIHQQAVVRFTICRNLLVIQKMLLLCGKYDGNALEAIRTVCLPEIVILTRVSYVMLYLTELISLPVLRSESTAVLLSSLKLNPVFNLKIHNHQTVTLLNLFITSTGGFEAHKMLAKLGLDEEITIDWNISLLLYTHLVNQLLWPLSGDAAFPEWLLTSGQHIWLQQYWRLLKEWCECNNCTRTFLLAVSFLSTGEHHKAECLFVNAANGIFKDKFLMDRILTIPGSEDKKADVNYYLKVIQLFNLYGARDCAINIANIALSIADHSDPHVATLYSIKFKHHLALKHYDEAYNSININPDEERKKDNIRDLIKTLFDRRELDRLLVYSDVGLDLHFYKIIIGHARSADPMDNLYYDFLYAFFITRGTPQMRMAATVMYEQAFRLQQYNTVEALEKQVKSYLACINVLHLTPQNVSPVLRPTDPDAPLERIQLPASFDDDTEVISLKPNLDVVYISDVKKELELASARLRLLRYNPDSLANNLTTPTEVVSFLCAAGIFKYALLLCKTFGLKYDVVFDALTKQCIYLSRTENPKAWNWLIENDLHDLNIVGSFPSTVAWNLLQMYLEEYEEENSSALHKVICHRIIQLNSFIPQWILSSYKIRNASELFRLYFNNGLVDDAVTIASEYLLAALGHGKEYYGFSHALSPVSPQFNLPLFLIQKLLKELALQNEENPAKPFEKEYENLSGLLKDYLNTAQRVSREMVQIKLKRAELPSCVTVAL